MPSRSKRVRPALRNRKRLLQSCGLTAHRVLLSFCEQAAPSHHFPTHAHSAKSQEDESSGPVYPPLDTQAAAPKFSRGPKPALATMRFLDDDEGPTHGPPSRSAASCPRAAGPSPEGTTASQGSPAGATTWRASGPLTALAAARTGLLVNHLWELLEALPSRRLIGHAARWLQFQVQPRLCLDVVVQQCATILQLLPCDRSRGRSRGGRETGQSRPLSGHCQAYTPAKVSRCWSNGCPLRSVMRSLSIPIVSEVSVDTGKVDPLLYLTRICTLPAGCLSLVPRRHPSVNNRPQGGGLTAYSPPPLTDTPRPACPLGRPCPPASSAG
jgi:hypothetical protein